MERAGTRASVDRWPSKGTVPDPPVESDRGAGGIIGSRCTELTCHAIVRRHASSRIRSLAAECRSGSCIGLCPAMSISLLLDRIRVASGRIRARVSSCIPAANRKQIGRQSSSVLVEDPSGADVVLAATISAVRAEASVSELESLEVRHSRLPTAHFPSTRAHIDLIGSRVRKAQFHAARARAHANAAVLIFMGGTEDQLGSPLEDLKRHAEQAKQAQVLASDLLEISLTLERREKSRSPRCR